MAGNNLGQRMDSAHAYLAPLHASEGPIKENLEVIQGATVTQILLKGSRAYGLEYLLNPDGEKQVRSCCAVWRSPHLSGSDDASRAKLHHDRCTVEQ